MLKFRIDQIKDFKTKLIYYCSGVDYAAILDSCRNGESKDKYSKYDLLAGIGAKHIVKPEANHFDKIKESISGTKDWWFGHLAYDLKNQLEEIESSNPDRIAFPEILFFVPEILLRLESNELYVEFYESDFTEDQIFKMISEIKEQKSKKYDSRIDVKQTVSKDEYLEIIAKIKQDIKDGKIYETNFCQEFYAENSIDPYTVYNKLIEVSPSPFSCFYKLEDRYLLCASPERYIQKTNDFIISQPIKGTAKRGVNPQEDNDIKEKLRVSEKERAENIMIVDLVRNDLSKTAKKGTVKVEELCQIYSFPQVHQMISTISSQLSDKYHFVDCIKETFPMGSMTGAPKLSSMKLMEEYEKTKRGLYSGSVGYISPNSDFDFNVIIRSIQYNSSKQQVSFMAGGAITYKSDPESEYDECLLKLKAINSIL